MEREALIKAVEVSGAVGSITFLAIYFMYRLISEKTSIASKVHTPALLKWFLGAALILGICALAAWYLSGRNSVTIDAAGGRVLINSSTDSKLPPINIDSRIIQEAAKVDPLLINKVEDQAVKLFAQATSLQEANQRLEKANLDLADWQFLYFEQALPQSIEMFRDLSALRNYRVTIQAFNERWSPKLQGSDLFEKIFSRVLVAYGWATVNDEVVSITQKGKSVLIRRGGEGAAFPISGNIPNWCPSANTWVERQICSDSTLAEAEVRLLHGLSSARIKYGATIDADQNGWRKNTRDRCLSIECLREAYKIRISYLARLN